MANNKIASKHICTVKFSWCKELLMNEKKLSLIIKMYLNEIGIFTSDNDQSNH